MAEHSIFGGAPFPQQGLDPQGFIDNPDDGHQVWTGLFFYMLPPPAKVGWTMTKVLYWVPPGSSGIGRTLEYAGGPGPTGMLQVWDNIPNIINGMQKQISQPLVAGWNALPLVTPAPIPDSTYFLVAGRITQGERYTFSPFTNGDAAIPASDGTRLWISEQDSANSRYRGLFVYVDGGGFHDSGFVATYFGWDVILDDNSTPAPATGSFGGEYGWRPDQFTGVSPRSGSFGGTLGWGEAQFSGATASGGGFLGTYGWGSASWDGASARLGTFGGQYGWGPATMRGEVFVGGTFATTYGWGPAGFIGFGEVPDNFPVCDFDLVGTGPTLGLDGKGPSLGLEASCSS